MADKRWTEAEVDARLKQAAEARKRNEANESGQNQDKKDK